MPGKPTGAFYPFFLGSVNSKLMTCTVLVQNNYIFHLRMLNTVADPGGGHPDPETGGSPKNFLSALRASVWSKNKGGRVLRAPPLNPPLEYEMLADKARSVALVIIISYSTCVRMVFTSNGVGIRTRNQKRKAYDLVKTAFRFLLRLRRLRSADCRSRKQKRKN